MFNFNKYNVDIILSGFHKYIKQLEDAVVFHEKQVAQAAQDKEAAVLRMVTHSAHQVRASVTASNIKKLLGL
jgi:hypothetical protein